MLYLKLLRPKDWAKNLFLFVPLFFAGEFFEWAKLVRLSLGFIAFSLIALGGITLLNIRGVKPGKWLNNAGGIGMFLPVLILIVLAAISWTRSGSATHFTFAALVPHASMKNAIFWSTIFFAYGGVECTFNQTAVVGSSSTTFGIQFLDGC